uniref:C1q-like domain-containing protein n=1 Tax=Xanthomonas albilineans TaxID=29447 RepID=UPI0027DB1F1B|nr:hypothetical protein [Xanthomonas albilineans]
MADIKISQLPDAATLDGTERFPIVQAAQNTKASPDQLASYTFGLLQGYIEGLKLQWVSTTSLRVTSGAAYVPSVKRIIALVQSVTMASLALDASAWYHCYLTASAGIQLVKDAPDTAYSGIARTKTADSSCRYLGSILTDASSAIQRILPLEDYDKTDIYAEMTANQALSTAGAFTTVVYNSEVRDQLGEYNPATGECTIQSHGMYTVAAFVHAGALADGTNFAFSVFVNGTERYRLAEQLPRNPTNGGYAAQVGSTTIADLKAGDVVTLRVYIGAFASSTGNRITGMPALTYFSIRRAN